MTDKINKAEINKLSEMRQDLIFLPNPAHRRAKSKFWARYSDITGEKPSQAEVMQITNEPSIRKWWALPGFKEWFYNEDEARERLEYLYMVALDAAEQVLLNPDANDNAKVQMIKIISQLAGKDSKNDRYVDDDIQRMDEKRLKAYITKYAPKLISGEKKPTEESE